MTLAHWIKRSVCFLKFLKPFARRKASAKKYIVTDAGGNGDLTRLTHRYHLWITSIKGGKSCVMLSSKNPNMSVTYTLEELQGQIPPEMYLELVRLLAAAQTQREMSESERQSYWVK